MSTQFRTIQLLLGEDLSQGDDLEVKSIVSGVRKGWASPLETVEKQAKRCWKKLSPEQQNDLCSLMSVLLQKLLASPESPANTKSFIPSDKAEAVAITIGLLNLSKSLEHVARAFIRRAQAKNEAVLSDSDVEAAIRGNLYDLSTISVREFAKAHGKHITGMVKCGDGLPKIDIPVSLSNLLSAISKTPAMKQREAILAVFQLLMNVSGKLKDAQQQLTTEFASMKLKRPDSAL